MFSGEQPTTIDLIRHGEPLGGRKFRGSLDDVLSDAGWRQMRDAVAPGAPWQRIINSPLLRCSEFAHELAGQHDIPQRVERGFREVHFGLWEGLTGAEIMAEWPGLLDKVWSDPVAHTAPEGELLLDFKKRVAAAWDKTLAMHAGQHLLVIAHGGTIRMILCHALGLPIEHMWRIDVQYASLSRLRAWPQPDGGANHALVFHAATLPRSTLPHT